MPIEFPENCYIDYGIIPAVHASAARTLMAWTKITSGVATLHAFISDNNVNWIFYYSDLLDGDADCLKFQRLFSGDPGTWKSGTASISFDTWYHVAVAYDETNVTNDPVFYKNGTALSVSESSAPVGTPIDDSTSTIRIGKTGAISLSDARIYNRILTADEVLDIYNSKSYDSVPRGLVFQARGYGCAGKQVFDGAALGAANTVIDYIGGVVGTPAGSPVGRADNLLSCNP